MIRWRLPSALDFDCRYVLISVVAVLRTGYSEPKLFWWPVKVPPHFISFYCNLHARRREFMNQISEIDIRILETFPEDFFKLFCTNLMLVGNEAHNGTCFVIKTFYIYISVTTVLTWNIFLNSYLVPAYHVII